MLFATARRGLCSTNSLKHALTNLNHDSSHFGNQGLLQPIDLVSIEWQ